MKPADVKRTVYPLLPDIMDPDSLSLITHLEEQEKEFILQARTPRLQYLRAIYLKAMSYFRHSRYAPGDLPRLMRLKIAEQLNLPKKLADILKIHPVEKSRLVGEIRGFLNIKRYTRQDRQKVEAWLEQDLAREENNILVLINAIINWFKDAAIDIPRFGIVTTMAESALNAANTRLQKLIASAFDKPQSEKIKKLVKRTGGHTPLSRFKADPRKASTVNLQAELERLKQLQDYIFDIPAMRTISREKVEYFADIGRRYTAAEIDQFNPQQCITVLHCYLLVRRCELLDAAVETFIQVWREVQVTAKQYADEYRNAHMQMQSEHDLIYRNLLDFICDLSDRELVISIRGYRSPEEYKSLRKNARRKLSWSECYYQKIKDHYTTLRRFLPNWYRTVPMVSTAAGDSILKAVAFIAEHGDSKENRLPAPNISFDFLSPMWASRSLIRHSWDDRVKMLHKTPFELGMVDTVAKALKDGRIAVEGASRYGPMMEHLIARDDFLADYSRHLSKVGQSENANECYQPCINGLEHQLDDYDRDYEDIKNVFRVNANGTLSYLRSSPQSKPRRIKKSASILQTYMTPATILEILLDCHSLTGFLDLFSPLTGRRHMSENDRILRLLAAFYAYGCNCDLPRHPGPSGSPNSLSCIFAGIS